MKTQKVFLLENSILIVNSTTEGHAGRKYVSVTADRIIPISKEDAIRCEEDCLRDGELWRNAVAGGYTTEGLEDWISTIDPLECFDNSLYPREIDIDGEDYIFSSDACGCLHDDIKEATNLFNRLIDLHLKGSDADILEAENIISSIPTDDVDLKVLEITKEILNNN